MLCAQKLILMEELFLTDHAVDRYRDLHYRLFSQNKHSAFDTVIRDLYTIVHMSLL